MDEIVGIILLKCDSNTEKKTTDFAKILFKSRCRGKPCGKDCIYTKSKFIPFMDGPEQILKRTKSKLPCDKLTFWKFSTFSGFFDFFFVVSAVRMKDIEDFVIYCIRGSSGKLKKCITETQTVIGSIICPQK